MSYNPSEVSHKENNENTDEHKSGTVSCKNVPNFLQECMTDVNSLIESLLTYHDLFKNYLETSLINAKSDDDLVTAKQLATDYKNVTCKLIHTSDRLIELIEKLMSILIDGLQIKQEVRDHLERCLDRISVHNVIIEDAAQLYCLTEMNDTKHKKFMGPYADSREMLVTNHNLGVTSLNTIEGTQVHHVKRLICEKEDEKKLNRRQINRALEAYNQYILVFPLVTRTDEGAKSPGDPKQRRSTIPERAQSTLSMWSVLKSSIGKDLSKIPMPVNFSEPLSALQRLVECFEYSYILDRAADCSDEMEQMAYVAAFYVSGYSTNSTRTAKPFNPLLGETFEWDRTDDYGWRVIAEQVSHHPPISALHCTGKEWTCWEEFSVVTKFRGRYLTAEPRGTVHLEFNKENGHHYTWKKVTTTIHNIIIGRMWVEQLGEVDVTDHTNGAKCHVNFLPNGGYFAGRDTKNRVFATVKDNSNQVRWLVEGVWDQYIQIGLVTSVEGPTDKPVYKTMSKTMVWECTSLPPDSENRYNFTLLARQLNEMEDDVAPTDSRRRPDQRLMEEGNWDAANNVKVLLEEKQRRRRAELQNRTSDSDYGEEESATLSPSQQAGVSSATNATTTYQPVWFKQQVDDYTKELIYVYQKGYWEAKQEQDWSMCPNIFMI